MTHPNPYPDRLSEIERVEIASAIAYHFDHCATPDEFPSSPERRTQYEILCAVVDRILLTRAGLFPERSVR